MKTEIKYLDKEVFTPPINLSQSDIAYFDIETTGFSADVSTLYLIGLLYLEGKKWALVQWFADDSKSERLMLESFISFVKTKKHLICYNGKGFDLPFLKKRCVKYRLDLNTDSFEAIDFYRNFTSFKAFLTLKGLKQKDMEKYLGIEREDKFSGRELTEYYSRYLKLSYSSNPEAETIYKVLVLHNSDDLLGLARLTPLYNFIKYLKLFANDEDARLEFVVEVKTNKNQKKTLQIKGNLDCILPKEIDIAKGCYKVSFTGDYYTCLTLETDLIETELKLFYKDYRSYYYLPLEDTVIHKSLAAFVDKENKERASASNCYTKHRGLFASQPFEIIAPALKTDYADKSSYFLIDDRFLGSQENINKLVKSILNISV